MFNRDIPADKALCDAATSAPWAWVGNTHTHSVDLRSTKGWSEIVMDFTRWGSQSAQPRFRVNGLMEKVVTLFKHREDHHRGFNLDIDHPDARFIAEARTALPAYIARVEELEQELNEAYVDENGTAWTRPTAWAYFAVCKARNNWQERAKQAEQERDAYQSLLEEVKSYFKDPNKYGGAWPQYFIARINILMLEAVNKQEGASDGQ